MQHIENETYYHIQTKTNYKSGFWKVGESYFLGDTKNPFTQFFDIFDSSNVSDEYLRQLLEHYQKFARETIFEEVRKSYFPNLPSRFTCLWVIPDDEQAINYWKGIFTADKQLVKLKLTGIIHKTNDSFLQLNRNSMDHNRKLAFKYWNGTSGNSSVEDEYLFQGFAEVEEVTNL